MRIPRIYHPSALKEGSEVTLRPQAQRHLRTVLRLRPGAPLILFDGEGHACRASLRENDTAAVGPPLESDTESPLTLHLLQGVSKGERMDHVVQKATELGVTTITPVLTRRCVVRLAGERAEKRLRHWREIVIHACEQCGRNRLPLLREITPLDEALNHTGSGMKLVLNPADGKNLGTLQPPQNGVTLLVGPEGGLSGEEIRQAIRHGFVGLRLGPRTLRTETAPIAALSALQTLWGDLG